MLPHSTKHQYKVLWLNAHLIEGEVNAMNYAEAERFTVSTWEGAIALTTKPADSSVVR